MTLLITAMIAAYWFLTIFANQIGFPAFLTAVLPVPIAFAAGYVLSRIMRATGAL